MNDFLRASYDINLPPSLFISIITDVHRDAIAEHVGFNQDYIEFALHSRLSSNFTNGTEIIQVFHIMLNHSE